MVSLPLRTPFIDVVSSENLFRSRSLPSQMRISMHFSSSRWTCTDVLTRARCSCCRSVSLSPTDVTVWS